MKITLSHGTRGWNFGEEEENKKILNRELLRLEISIKDGIEKFGKEKDVMVCMHYPPTIRELMEESEFIKLMQKYNVKICIYGHLHGDAHQDAIEGEIGGVNLMLVSSDYLDFNLKRLV